MGVRPDNMERWGILGIFKEAARLLHKHCRLFLPFYLAFQIPASFLALFFLVFLVPSPHPPGYTSFVKTAAAYSTAQVEDVHIQWLPRVATDSQPPLILAQSLSLLDFIFSTLVLAAFTYIVAYIYSNADTGSDDNSISKKVFKLLPRAFLRIFVTQLWVYVVLVLLAIACLMFAFILNAIFTAIIGGPSGPTPAFFLFLTVPNVIGGIAVMIMFALAQFVAVLEQEKYGRAALKQSIKYARRNAGIIFCFLFLTTTVGLLIAYVPAQAVAKAGLPLWWKIIVAISLSILNSLFAAYVRLVGVVLYFVCKSKFEAVLPEFQRGSNIPAAESPHKPLVSGSAEPKTIG